MIELHVYWDNKIAQASEGCDVQLEYHEWQGEYMTGPVLKDAW